MSSTSLNTNNIRRQPLKMTSTPEDRQDLASTTNIDLTKLIIPFPNYPPIHNQSPLLDQLFACHPPMITTGISVITLTKRMGVDPIINLERISKKDLDQLEAVFSNFPSANKKQVQHAISLALAAGATSLPLAELFPLHVQKMIVKVPPTGTLANCLNATQIWHSPAVRLEATDKNGFRGYLEDFFSLLDEGQSLTTGNIIAWRARNNLTSWEDHAAVYLTNNLVWHKLGFGRTPWCMETLENITAPYAELEQGVAEYYQRVYRQDPDKDGILTTLN